VRLVTTRVKREGRVKSFACRDAGVICKARVTGETEEEVLAKAVEHAREKHGVDLGQSSTLANYAKGLIRDDAEARAS
jgi:predicted small metal-binding protein